VTVAAPGRFRAAMRMLVFTLLGVTALIFAFGLGLGAQVGAIIGSTVIVIGVVLHGVQPVLDWLTKP
jgi:membrane-bound ClpP family serine protease